MDPEERPAFEDIRQFLARLLGAKSAGYGYLDCPKP
jgi:hypothetical protein